MSVIDEFLLNFNFQKIGIKHVILSGGGANHYLDALRQRLPRFQITAATDSVMDNARGFWLSGNDLLSADSEAA